MNAMPVLSAPAAAPAAARESVACDGACLVLVVDDDARTARRFASMLAEDGFLVEVLADGREAIERLAREPRPDAIVTDLIMPRASGIAVLGEARRRWPSLPVVFVTGHPELLGRPGIPFEPSPIVFTKPFSYVELTAKLRELLGAQEAPPR